VEIAEIAVILGQVASGPIPFQVFFTSLFLKFDPFYFVFDDLFGPLQNQPLLSYLAIFAFRCLLLLGTFECARSLSYCIVTLPTIYILMKKHLTNLLSPRTNLWQRIWYYKLTLIVYQWMKPLVEQVLSLCISTMFWIIIAVLWVAIRGINRVPLFIYLLFVGLAVTTPPLFILVLSQISEISAVSEKITRKCVVEAKLGLASSKFGFRKKKATKLVALSLKKLNVEYAPFVAINEDFVMSVFSKQFDRLFDAVIIFE